MSEKIGGNGNGPDAVIAAWVFESGLFNKLSEGEMKIYVLLRRYQRGGMTQITLKTLGSKANITRGALYRILKSLQLKGALKNYFKPGAATAFLRPDSLKNTWVFYT